jgi:hypothetical protein
LPGLLQTPGPLQAQWLTFRFVVTRLKIKRLLRHGKLPPSQLLCQTSLPSVSLKRLILLVQLGGNRQ